MKNTTKQEAGWRVLFTYKHYNNFQWKHYTYISEGGRGYKKTQMNLLKNVFMNQAIS